MDNVLSRLFTTKPAAQAPVGSGMADMARASILRKQYEDHVNIAKQTGDEPMSYEEFLRSKQQGS